MTMNRDIWHTTNEKPMLHRDIILCGDGWSMPIDIIPETVDNICWENVEKWCYVDDLLALEIELNRTRKALDVALNCLNGVVKELPWVKRALDEITELEQKDVK